MTPHLTVAISSFLMGLVAIKTNIAEAFLNALMNTILAPALARYLG